MGKNSCYQLLLFSCRRCVTLLKIDHFKELLTVPPSVALQVSQNLGAIAVFTRTTNQNNHGEY